MTTGNLTRRELLRLLALVGVGGSASEALSALLPSNLSHGAIWGAVWSEMNAELISSHLLRLGFKQEDAAQLAAAIVDEEVRDALSSSTMTETDGRGQKVLKVDFGTLGKRLAVAAVGGSVVNAISPDAVQRLDRLKSLVVPGPSERGLLPSQWDRRGDVRLRVADIRKAFDQEVMRSRLLALGFGKAETDEILRRISQEGVALDLAGIRPKQGGDIGTVWWLLVLYMVLALLLLVIGRSSLDRNENTGEETEAGAERRKSGQTAVLWLGGAVAAIWIWWLLSD